MARSPYEYYQEIEAAKRVGHCIKAWVSALVGFIIFVLIGFCSTVHRPKIYLEEFFVPALLISPENTNSNITGTSHAIFFELRLHNSMKHRGVRYHPLNITFYHVPKTTFSSNSPLLVAKHTVPGFYQGCGKTALRRGVVVASGVPWAEAIQAVSGGSTAVFKVHVEARMRFKFLASYAWRKGVNVWANVEVDGSGRKTRKDGIRFLSIPSGTPSGSSVAAI